MKFLSILLGTATSVVLLSEMSAVAQQPSEPTAPPNATDNYVTEVDEEEIKSFANAFSVVQDIQQDSRDKMEQVIQEEGLTIQEYNELYRGQQMGSDAESSEISEQKQQQFEQADARIDEIEQEAQAAIEQAITDEGLELERFEEIGSAVRSDPELQEQVKTLLEE